MLCLLTEVELPVRHEPKGELVCEPGVQPLVQPVMHEDRQILTVRLPAERP